MSDARLPKKRVACSCGIEVLESGLERHLAGKVHAAFPQALEMARDGATLREISSKLGVSSSIIHARLEEAGFEGLGRRVRAQRKREALELCREQRIRPTVHHVRAEAAARGLSVTHEGRNRLVINAHRCVVRGLHRQHDNRDGEYYILRTSPLMRRQDFAIFVSDRGDILIVPRLMLPEGNATSIALHDVPPGSPGYAKQFRHDWRQYIEAWHFLMTARKETP